MHKYLGEFESCWLSSLLMSFFRFLTPFPYPAHSNLYHLSCFFFFPHVFHYRCSMDLHKNLDLTSNPSSTSANNNTMSITNTPLAIPLNQLVKASPLTLGLSSAAAAAAAAAVNQSTLFDLQTAITNRKSLTTKLRASTHNGSKKTERNKFTPY